MEMQGEIQALLEKLRRETERLDAKAQIENLMGRYAQLHSTGRDREILEDLWSRREDSTMEEGFSGVYKRKGRLSGISDYYAKAYGMPKADDKWVTEEPGRMYIDALTSPVIEIADDLQTAKGSWITTGTATRSEVNTPDGGNGYRAFWVWGRTGADFVREDGEWKIWHLHIYELFRCPFEKNWVDYAKERLAAQLSEDTRLRTEDPFLLPSGPSRDYWQYFPDGGMPERVLIPEPYDRFQNTFTY